MSLFKKKTKDDKIKKAGIITAVFVVIIILLITITPVVAYELIYANKIYRGVSVDNVLVGNLTKSQAREKIQSHLNNMDRDGVVFVAGNKKVAITPTITAISDIDLTYELISFDTDKAIQEAYNVGRNRDIFNNIFEQTIAIFKGIAVDEGFVVDKNKLTEALQENFKDLEDPGMNPQIMFIGKDIIVGEGKSGVKLDYEKAVKYLEQNLKLGNQEIIKISIEKFNPEFTKKEIEDNVSLITDYLDKVKNIVFKYEDKEWKLSQENYRNMLYFKKNNGEIKLVFDEEKLTNYLNGIKSEIDTAPTDAVLEFNKEKTEVVKFEPQIKGTKLNVEESVKNVNDNILNIDKGVLTINLAVDSQDPKVSVKDLNSLGIKEILGVGTSDYGGSPRNRRHNVEVGRKAFDGVLLAPGEEFSALKSIGDVDASNGYLQELVIKGNKTIPEYGGGLCQVSTTIFRAALDAGLEITQRRSHSYNVSYYAPTGTDATIYSPAPDFKFKNDTENYILIHTINDTKNSKLIYQIWGTKDGRKVSMTKPVTYDWVAPPPTKIVETLDLPVGQKKCTESAHYGVKAYFDRVITYLNRETHEERFNSSYRPWQAVCLVGVEKLSDEVSSVEKNTN